MPDSPYRVLVVDDSSVNRSWLHFLLDEDGYTVCEAASGEDCLARIGECNPGLVLLDVVMTGIDGFETLKRLQEEPALSMIPVIMLTSMDDQESKLKAFELGAVDYIVKSANAAEIKARVRVHIRLALANRELMRLRTESVRQISAAQHALLPKCEDYPQAGFAGYYRAVHEAGGDFYDVIPVAKDLWFYLMADVAGHDVGTSYITPAVKVLFKQFATPAYTVEETLSYMNGVLAQTVCQENYLTAFALRLNRRTLKAVFVAAGHPPAVYIPIHGEPRFIGEPSPIIGMIEGMHYQPETLDVQKGDRFLLYTDGLIEDDRVGASWVEGKDILLPLAQTLSDVPLGKIPRTVVKRLGREGDADDDIAVLAIEV